MVNNLECSLSKKCGNCPLGSHTYQETIKIKQDYVNKLFKDASINKKIDNMNEVLPIYNNYSNDDEYFNLLFTYIISLKEENAKLIEKIENI